MRRLILALTLLMGVTATTAPAQSGLPPAPYAYRQLDDPAQEAAAKELMESLRCLVCQGQSIADSDASLAGDMRSQVRERIQAGEQPEAIRAWLIQRYGDWVSYKPVFGAQTALLYLAPLLALLLGGWLVLGRFRRANDEEDAA